jgi:AraC-like DNA-binding protein
LRDPVVGQALSLLHTQPARDWTVADLAVAVAASKTVLADRFLQLLDRPAIRYLTQWRLHLASGLLRTTGLGVGEIGATVGYNCRGGVQPRVQTRTRQGPCPLAGGGDTELSSASQERGEGAGQGSGVHPVNGSP